ncbi:MAG: thiol:disulfide interchange protein DsbA/DsbL [Gammaproteobacteria bacterium]
MLKKWMLVLFTSFLFATPVVAQMAFVEGVDYKRIDPPVPTSDPARVVVTEIFWYGCPHCFRFEPFVEKWAESLPDGVVFEQVPSAINAAWSVHARAYYAFKMMGVQDQIHKKLFNAIHVQRQRLNSLDSIAEFVAEQGFDEKEFRKQYASFPVDSLVRKGKQKELHYGLEGVPTIIINGKYRTSGVMAGNFNRLLQIIDFLVAEELKG